MKLDLNPPAIARLLWPIAIGIVVVGSLAPSNSFLIRAVGNLHVQDKTLHFASYVCLAILPVLGIRRTTHALAGAGSMMLVGLLLEVTQHLMPGRSPEVADQIANTLGVACGMAVAFPFRRSPRTAAP